VSWDPATGTLEASIDNDALSAALLRRVVRMLPTSLAAVPVRSLVVFIRGRANQRIVMSLDLESRTTALHQNA